ncbi:hypothetical protein HEK616_21150 [Streptomyces nigrescens]|uniref:Uncharacterized protein n=1 Tax=Streptomyces nigrescens TaxID=1920 RepID=A0ABN6QUG4_STRNI|nr:hypothetical protein HEK616_21150 [Streptomyces nigrescens]
MQNGACAGHATKNHYFPRKNGRENSVRGAMRSGSRTSEPPGDSPLDNGPALLHELVPPGPELLTITVRVLRAERGSMLFGHAKLTHAVLVSDIAREVLLPSPYGKSRGGRRRG